MFAGILEKFPARVIEAANKNSAEAMDFRGQCSRRTVAGKSGWELKLEIVQSVARLRRGMIRAKGLLDGIGQLFRKRLNEVRLSKIRRSCKQGLPGFLVEQCGQ